MTMSAIPDFKYYLFDVDGTLLDTSEMIYQTFRYLSSKYGAKELSKAEVIPLIGLPLSEIFRRHYPAELSSNFAAVVAQIHAFQNSRIVSMVSLFPSVLSGLVALKEQGKKLGVVTSRNPETLGLLLEHFRLKAFFEVIITPADTTSHKPAPEPLLLALDKLSALPQEAVYIGDAEVDLLCAKAAGVTAVLVNWSQNDSTIFSVQPNYRIASMLELSPQR